MSVVEVPTVEELEAIPTLPAEPDPDEVVARLAVLLDDLLPGWAERVNPLLLDLQQPRMCVLGQAHPDGWTDGYQELASRSEEFADLAECDGGFGPYHARAFEPRWIEEIEARA